MEQGYSLVVTSTFGDVNREALSIDSLRESVEYILFLYGRIEAASQDKLREHNTRFTARRSGRTNRMRTNLF